MPHRHQSDDIYGRIRHALPLARRVIAERGIDPNASAEIAIEFDAASDTNFLVPSKQAWEYIYGVFVLGMAVGLSLDRSVLEQPGSAHRPRSRRGAENRRAISRRLMDEATKGGHS